MTTPRLLLRRWVRDDAPAIAPIYSDPETMRFFGTGDTFSVDELAQSLDDIVAGYAAVGYGNYAVIERESNAIIGHCGPHYVPERDRVEADILLERRVWGRGYATEAAAAAFERAFTIHGVTEIAGVAHRDNIASIAVMRKLGMTFRNELFAHGAPSVLYTIGRNERNAIDRHRQ